MALTTIDYVSMYFEFYPLTKVHREPTYEYLQQIKDEIKVNSARVKSDLRRGNNGNIVLLITPQEYTCVQVAAYLQLQQQTTLNVPQGTLEHLS